MSILLLLFINYCMITAKFGGTAVTPRNLHYMLDIVGPFHKCVVVSAVGKEYHSDVKATDLLIAYYHNPTDELWARIADKYRRLVITNAIELDIDALLDDARSRALNYDLNYCMSLGEELSARVVSAYLHAQYLEAEKTVRFNGDTLDIETTTRNVIDATGSTDLVVVGGFYGGSDTGRRTFSRGGSDITGAIFAYATNSTLYENWTDVAGVCVANPSQVSDVDTVKSMSYGEMYLLSSSGAEVLHPDAVAPVESVGIPIKIGNFANPHGPSTLVSHCPSYNKLLSIAEKVINGQFVTTVLHSYPQWKIARLIARFLRQNSAKLQFFDKCMEVSSIKVYNLELHDNVARLTTDRSILKSLYKSLCNDK